MAAARVYWISWCTSCPRRRLSLFIRQQASMRCSLDVLRLERVGGVRSKNRCISVVDHGGDECVLEGVIGVRAVQVGVTCSLQVLFGVRVGAR